jgi:hypothetical protein
MYENTLTNFEFNVGLIGTFYKLYVLYFHMQNVHTASACPLQCMLSLPPTMPYRILLFIFFIIFIFFRRLRRGVT